MRLHVVLLLLLVLLPVAARAATPLPVYLPDGLYVQQDESAWAYHAPAGSKADLRAAIDRAIRHDPASVRALMQRAYLLNEAGDIEQAQLDMAAALKAAKPGSIDEGNVFWSQGWMSYDRGEYEAALAAWKREIASHGGHPFWVPYTFALLYWSAGDVETSMAWFDATVATEPSWGQERSLDERIAHWRPAQRTAMRQAFAEWSIRHAATAATVR